MEPLTRELVVDCLKTLAVTFPQRGLTPDMELRRADVYRNGLSGLSGDALRFAIQISVQEDTFFPKVARLRQIAQRWVTAHPAREPVEHPLYCRGCHARSVWETRWRPALGAKGKHVTDARGRIKLEAFERLQCACSVPSRWTADGPDDPWMSP